MTLALVLMSLVFAIVLVMWGVDPVLASGLTVIIVVSIVACAMPRRTGDDEGVLRRVVKGLAVFAGVDLGPGPGAGPQ
ncbi:hypothetical protein ACWDYH_30970 [Nocardia goodfellowii]